MNFVSLIYRQGPWNNKIHLHSQHPITSVPWLAFASHISDLMVPHHLSGLNLTLGQLWSCVLSPISSQILRLWGISSVGISDFFAFHNCSLDRNKNFKTSEHCEMKPNRLGFPQGPELGTLTTAALRLYVDPEGLNSLPSDEQTSRSWKKTWVGHPVVGKVRKTLKMDKENRWRLVYRRIYCVLGFAFLLRDTGARLATLVAMAHFSVTPEGFVREWWFWEIFEAFPTRC